MGLELSAPQAHRRDKVCAPRFRHVYGPKSPFLAVRVPPPLKPGASDIVERAGGLLAAASPCAVVGAALALPSLSIVTGGDLPALPPPWAITLPTPAWCPGLGKGGVPVGTVGLSSVACVASGPKGSAMPSASCRNRGSEHQAQGCASYCSVQASQV